MANDSIQASDADIAAAKAYEDLHVPALFEQFAPIVTLAASVEVGDHVLDVACGTGVLARHIAELTGEPERVAGLDASPGMLAVAAKLEPRIDWQRGLAEVLPYADKTFDAVVSQFGLMFFRDRVAAIREMLRVLRPGGRLAVAVWESLERSEAYPEEVALLKRMAGDDAANALRAPFVLGDKAELLELFDAAGVIDVDIATHHGRAHFPGVRAMVEADLRGWLPVMGVILDDDTIEAILAAAGEALGDFVAANGEVVFTAPAHIITGRKPH
ncbi:MAG: methyltransferase domain-containing protein [Gammaproteobacteria bacterium]|nr:methyltransferase domain-containing protein [Gammaproteobacteria bacterium]